MASEKFKLPGSSYEELVKIIKAYGEKNAPVSPGDVASLIGIHETIVSRNNGFLLATGIIDGGQKKTITEAGHSLSLALEHDMADEAAAAWAQIVADSEFMQRILSAVRIRNGMELASLQSHVAYTAGQPNKGAVKTGSSTVVEILKAARAVVEQNGKLVVASRPDGGPPEAGDIPPRDEPAGIAETVHVEPASPDDAGLPVVVQVRVQINCGVDEIPALRSNLRDLLRDLRGATSADAEG